MFVLCLKRAKVMQHVILNKARAQEKFASLILSKTFICEYCIIYE